MPFPNSGSPSRELFKRDEQFWWRPGRIYIPAWQFAGLAHEATATAGVKSFGTGTQSGSNMLVQEINTSGVTGVQLDANSNTICHMLEVPPDVDLAYPIYFSIYWTANNTSGSVQWDVFYKAIVANSTVIGSAEAATALDATIANSSMAGVAYTVMRTAEGRIYGGKLGLNTELLNLTVRKTSQVTITTPFFLGMAIRYTRQQLYYGSMIREAKAPAFIAADHYSN